MSQPRLAVAIPVYNARQCIDSTLHSVQKQFLGMGPRNVRAVQASLLDIAREIGIDPNDLPTPEVVR